MSKTYRHQQIQDVYDARRHAPTPALVTEGKARITNGIRLSDDRPDRIWYCRSCGATATARVIPDGWYSVTRHTGTMDERPARYLLLSRLPGIGRRQLDQHAVSAGTNRTGGRMTELTTICTHCRDGPMHVDRSPRACARGTKGSR